MSTDNKEVYIDPKAVALVDAKIRESKAMTHGMMSSWARPLEGITEGPQGKITVSKEPERHVSEAVTKPVVPANGLVEIPLQAMKQFKVLLQALDSVTVLLTADQARMLTDLISDMPTPKKMSDAKAIIRLSDQLDAVRANV